MFKCVTSGAPATHETWVKVNGEIINHAFFTGRELLGYTQYLETIGCRPPEVHRLQEEHYRTVNRSPRPKT